MRRQRQGADSITQLVKCPLCKREYQSSMPRTHIKNAGIGVHTSNSRAGEEETGGSWGLLISQLSPLGQLQASERFFLKYKTTAKVDVSKGSALRTDLCLSQARVHRSTCTCRVYPHAHTPVRCSHIHRYLHTCAATYIPTHNSKDSVTQPPGAGRAIMHLPSKSSGEALPCNTMV